VLNQVEQPTSPSSNFRCVADGEHVLTGARAGNWRACTCSPQTAPQCSIRSSSAPVPQPPSSPSSEARSPSSFSRLPVLFRPSHAPSHAPSRSAVAAAGRFQTAWSCKAATT